MIDHKQNIIETLDLLEAGLKPDDYRSNKMRPRHRMIYWTAAFIFYGLISYIIYELIF
jgi:hypothetical protein